MQPPLSFQKVSNLSPPVGTTVVPHDDDIAPQCLKQVVRKVMTSAWRMFFSCRLKYTPRRRLLGLTDRPDITEMRWRT